MGLKLGKSRAIIIVALRKKAKPEKSGDAKPKGLKSPEQDDKIAGLPKEQNQRKLAAQSQGSKIIER